MSQSTFGDRLSRITERHDRLSLGVTYRIDADGLVKPVAKRRVGRRLPWKLLLLLVAALWLFKAGLFVGLGEAVYVARLELFAEEGRAGEAVAWAMRPDPVMAIAADLAARAELAWFGR
jgi:hypothetical protein